MNIIRIGGVSPPAPTSYRVTLSDIDGPNSGRAENAVMIRDRIRENVAKIEVAWKNLNTSELTGIIGMVTPVEFQVDYFFGSMRTATMYAGDKAIELKSTDESGDSRWDVSLSLVEY